MIDTLTINDLPDAWLDDEDFLYLEEEEPRTDEDLRQLQEVSLALASIATGVVLW